MREDREQARTAQPHVRVEVGHLVEHGQRFVDLIERGGFDLHPDLAHCGNAEEHRVAQPLGDAEQLLGVDEASSSVAGSRVASVVWSSTRKQRDLVTKAPGTGDGLVGEDEASFPIAALRQLEGERGEQPRPFRAVVGAGDDEGALEHLDALGVHSSGAAGAASVVRERGTNEGVVVPDALGERGRVEQRLAERVGVRPTLRTPEGDQQSHP